MVDLDDRLDLESAFRGLFEASPYGLLIVDGSDNIAMANCIVDAVLGHIRASLEQQPRQTLLPERYRGGHGALTGNQFA